MNEITQMCEIGTTDPPLSVVGPIDDSTNEPLLERMHNGQIIRDT